MKETILLFTKGFIIGIGKVIPGVSGSVLALLLNVYEEGVYALSHFWENPKKHFLFLCKTGCGILLSLVWGSHLLLFLLNQYYLPIMLLFCGLIFGTLPMIQKKTNHSFSCICIFLFTFCLCLPFAFLDSHSYMSQTWSMKSILYLVLTGFVEASTMIIPGISGTAILMLMGVYPLVLNTFSHLLSVSYMQHNIAILLPFGIGLFLGVFLVTKGIYYFLKKDEEKAYSAILGFSTSSLLLLFKETIVPSTCMNYVIGLLLFILGYFISSFFASKE